MAIDEPESLLSGDSLRRTVETPELPFALLPHARPETLREIEAIATRANERYLAEIIEGHAFCPFSRGGRAQRQTRRLVHHFSDADLGPPLDQMLRAGDEPGVVVVQMIFPMIEVDPDAWIEFCQRLTALGNRQLGTGADVFAVAALHPELPYRTLNPYTLIPLFRRSPDPSIQWIRLDGLESLYEGRSGSTMIVDPADIEAFAEEDQRPPLFEQIAETNMLVAERLGIDNVERALAEIAASANTQYTALLGQAS